MNQEKDLEKAIDELFVLFKSNLSSKIGAEWNTATIHENEYILVTVNGFHFEVDFKHKPKVLIEYSTAPYKLDYNRFDLEYDKGKWFYLDYNDWKPEEPNSDFNENVVQDVIDEYLKYVKPIK